MTFVPLERKSKSPIAIYRQHTERGDFIWYFCEDGSEVGRKLNAQGPTGYDYDIPYDAKNVAKILALADRSRVKMYHKDIDGAPKEVSEGHF